MEVMNCKSVGTFTNSNWPFIILFCKYLFSDAGEFLLTGRIGSGTFAEAYLGKNIISHEIFVFKIYKFGRLDQRQMKREIAIIQHLCDHPNIIHLYHVVQQSLTWYPVLLFEFVNNTNSHSLYSNFSPKDVQFYAHEMLKGLAYAHRKGVIHKDLKPSNIVIDHEQRVLKIIDWGLSDFHTKGKKHLKNIKKIKHKFSILTNRSPYIQEECKESQVLLRTWPRSYYWTTSTQTTSWICGPLGVYSELGFSERTFCSMAPAVL